MMMIENILIFQEMKKNLLLILNAPSLDLQRSSILFFLLFYNNLFDFDLFLEIFHLKLNFMKTVLRSLSWHDEDSQRMRSEDL